MQNENEIAVGMEVMVDGIQWAIIEEVTENGFFVVDQDGGEMEVSASRIDVIG